MKKTMISVLGAAAMVLSAGVATADNATARRVSVLGQAEIDTHNPYSVFEFSVHAQGNGRSGTGVIWMSHHDDEQIGWMVARVDCVRVAGSLGMVTAVVSDVQEFAGLVPGDPVALTVRDNGIRDGVSFASGVAVTKCQRSREPEREITRGDFRVGR